MNQLDWIAGAKTYLAAAGLMGLALYQLSQAQYEQAYQSLMAAFALIGMRAAIAKNGLGK